MATNDANQPQLGRQLALQVVHTLRANIEFDSTGRIVGVLPEGAIVVAAEILTVTAFDDTTANAVDVGVQGGSGDEFIAASSVGTAPAFASGTVAAGDVYSADERVVVWDFSAAATGDGTAGEAAIVIRYAVDNG